jgi:hypothetical protein
VGVLLGCLSFHSAVFAEAISTTPLSTPSFSAPLISTDMIDPGTLYFQDNSDAYNEYWLRQQGDERHGSASLGRILQLGIKATYKSFRDRGNIPRSLPDEHGNGKISSVAEMKYKLRFKSDTVKLGMEYKF